MKSITTIFDNSINSRIIIKKTIKSAVLALDVKIGVYYLYINYIARRKYISLSFSELLDLLIANYLLTRNKENNYL